MTRKRRNIGEGQALAAMRRARDAGATDDDIIAAGVAKLGNDARARKTAGRVWRDNFAVMEAN